MDRRHFLIFLKFKVILFSLFVLVVPTAMTFFIDQLVAGLMFREDVFTALGDLFHEPWWIVIAFLYIQSLAIIFLFSLYSSMFKTIFIKNRDFFNME